MNLRRRVALTLLAALVALAFPASASAVVYEVNTTADEADKAPGAPCETNAAGICSLRAAIEVANSTTGVPDEIKFSVIFSGEDTDIIGLLSPLPTIVDQLKIRGGICDTDAGVKGPCASAIRAGGALLVVEDDDVEIQGLGLLGAGTAINVTNASERFVAKGNWIGFNLAGFPGVGAVNGIGIFLDPGSDDATIGGLTAADRNVIGGNSVTGLDLEGASGATIQGNYFGVTPQGDEAAPNPTNIEITDSTASGGFAAENNEIGETIEGAALTSDACDGGCNVISGAMGAGIDLNGNGVGQNEEPASGPTTIHGNFVGLDAAGTAAIGNNGAGVWVGGADHVLVGAPQFSDPAPERNYIAGGSEGIVSESGGNDLEARGNSIGFASNGAAATPPTTYGIFVLALSVTEESSVEDNDIRMAGGTGIEVRFLTGRITGNNLEGGARGIRVGVEPGDGLIASNTIEAPTEFGILVESPDTEVRNNDISDSGSAGIRVRNPPGIAMTGSRIGGNTAESENLIEGSGGDAIEILEEAGEPGSTTEIGRNRGSGNGGQFIDLVAGANEGIVSPAFSSATKTQAGGTADPETTIRLFRKASGDAGELQSFLTETVADGSGNWKASYPSIPGGTIVAATQTNEDGATSELSTATVPADPGDGGGGTAGGGTGGPGATPGPTDITAPTAKITKAPKAKSTSTTAKFKFKSNEAGSTFQCKLDKGKFKECKSPKTYRKLKLGKHVVKVRAIDKAGNVGKAAKRKFTVLAS